MSKVPRACLRCGTPTLNGTYCIAHDLRKRGDEARGYGQAYRQLRTQLRARRLQCWICGAPATTADHVPPLRSVSSPELWHGELRPACQPCNSGHRKGGSFVPAPPSDHPAGLQLDTSTEVAS